MAAVEPIVKEQIQLTNNSIIAQNGNGLEDSYKVSSTESFMEKLRAKQSRPWTDIVKVIRLAHPERKTFIENTEKVDFQKCLDALQKTIKVNSLQLMVERIESITRQQGLKFCPVPGPNPTEYYINSDMFYVEILLEPTGEVKEVKVAHHGDPPLVCSELTEVLRRNDFPEFISHLDGLSSIYQLNADKKQKAKAYLALQALETDLRSLAQFQSTINDPNSFVHKSPVGILQPRQGGHAMKLTYFISPYDLLVEETKTSLPLTVDTVIEKKLGHWVTVCIESSTAHKLQTVSLISITKTTEGKSLPSFAALSNLNSTSLPANFVLHLAKPLPMAFSLAKKIQNITNIECGDQSTCESLPSLITKHYSQGKLEHSSKTGLFVTLPDQHHCYHLKSGSELTGLTVSSIAFTHPTHVPQILVFLRQQLLFNTLLSSCVRPNASRDVESPWIFEVKAVSTSHITIGFEHPAEESLATIEIDLKDITNVKCKIFTLSSDAPISTDEYASKVMQRSLSIPVTMRAVIRKAQEKQKLARPSSQSDLYCAPSLHYLHYGASGGVAPAPEHDMYGNPLLGNILQAKQPNNNAMLMSMLNDVPSATNYPNFIPGAKPRKQKKRKAESRSPGSSSAGKSPKRKLGEEDLLPASAEGESNDMHYDMNLPYSSLMDGYGRNESSNQGFPLNQENKFHPSGDSLSETASLSHDVYNTFPKGQFPPNSNEYNTPGFNFPEAGSSEVAMEGCESAGSFGMGFSSGLMDQRQSKKMKRYKLDRGDSKESEDSNNESSDDQSKSEAGSKSRLSPILSTTSIKIAKSSDGLKVSKSESKQKKKEGKRLANLTEGSEEFSLKRRGESKKDRKRKRTEGAEGGEGKQASKPHHYTLEASSLSNPSDVGQSTEGQTVRPITLINMKPQQSSKSPVSNKKSPSSAGRSSSPLSKVPKLSQGEKSFSTKTLKVSSSDSGNAKLLLSTKTGSKHKVSSSSKGSSHSSFSSHGTTGSSKSKSHVLKLKHLPLPPSTTITPVSSSSPTPSPPPAFSQGSSSPPSKSSLNKALNKPKKSSLNAVINKLIVTASSNAQQGSPFGAEQSGKPEGGGNYKLDSEQRRSKDSSSSKDAAKDPEKSEKMKYSSSDQFTVKPSSSSQGINLKIMLKKTASGDGSSKSSSKLKSGSTKSANSPLKCSTPSKGNSPSNKKLSSPKSLSKVPRSHSPSSSLSKSSNSTSKDASKSSSKLSSSTLPKVPNNGSHHRTSEKSDKPKSSAESKLGSQEVKNDKIGNVVPLESNLMPPPPTGRAFSDHSRPPSTTPTRAEERQSPRLTPTEPLEEVEADKGFRMAETKPEEAEQNSSGKKLELENSGFIPVEQTESKLPPHSMMEDSSPEDSLVIDCPGTPRSMEKKALPCPKPAGEERSESSPAALPRPLKSPVALKSPAVAVALATNSPSSHSISSSMSRPSPCILDDELMDEAVMGLTENK